MSDVKYRALAAVRAAGLRARDWSAIGSGDVVLAVYTDGDSFVGCARFTASGVTAVQPWLKRD